MRSYPPAVRPVKTLRPRTPRAARAAEAPAVSAITLSVVVPIYNLSGALLDETFEELSTFRRRHGRNAELVLVDDGSGPETAARLESFAKRSAGVLLLRNEQNRGKGHAVARGLLESRGRLRVFTDADLAYPADEIDHIAATLEAGHDVAIACRVLPESRYVMSPAFFPYLYSRHVMSRIFNAAVRTTLIPDVLDSQAGLKGMTDAVARDVIPRLTISGFAFDVELLYCAHRRGYDIAQTPVLFRYDSEPSTMSFVRDAGSMLRDIARIRWNGALGRYA
ncbi:MAG TPA: glycosyltransferase [Gemmatimonadales bacterium]|jgi:dolichyl-phosphate beta-glucosyltransferase